MIHWESQLERDAVFLFEFSPGVVSFREQPIRTFYTLDGKTRRYTPDFELTLRTGVAPLIEVKPAERIARPDEARRFRAIEHHFACHGRPFQILTEYQIRQSELLENLRLAMRHRTGTYSPQTRRHYVQLFRKARQMSFGTAALLAGGPEVVWNLIDQRLLFCNLRSIVTEHTLLSTDMGQHTNEELYFQN
jgi:hypothetical protein